MFADIKFIVAVQNRLIKSGNFNVIDFFYNGLYEKDVHFMFWENLLFIYYKNFLLMHGHEEPLDC